MVHGDAKISLAFWKINFDMKWPKVSSLRETNYMKILHSFCGNDTNQRV